MEPFNPTPAERAIIDAETWITGQRMRLIDCGMADHLGANKRPVRYRVMRLDTTEDRKRSDK